MTAKECRRARKLLGWSQEQLAEAALAAIRTVQLFEAEKGQPHPITLQNLRRALMVAGVSFGDRPGAPAVQLRVKPRG